MINRPRWNASSGRPETCGYRAWAELCDSDLSEQVQLEASAEHHAASPHSWLEKLQHWRLQLPILGAKENLTQAGQQNGLDTEPGCALLQFN